MKFKELVMLASAQMLMTGIVHAAKYQDAPELAQLVKSGKLPAVEERLPDNPVVVGPGREVHLTTCQTGKLGNTVVSSGQFLISVTMTGTLEMR